MSFYVSIVRVLLWRVLASLMTDNLEAYRYYSLGLQKADAMQAQDAIALFERALARDPGFVMAHARIGYAYLLAGGGEQYLEKPGLTLRRPFGSRVNSRIGIAVTSSPGTLWRPDTARPSVG